MPILFESPHIIRKEVLRQSESSANEIKEMGEEDNGLLVRIGAFTRDNLTVLGCMVYTLMVVLFYVMIYFVTMSQKKL